ncbi:MAG: hypothetical protein ABID64_04445 [Nitrospirota bacterium]
MKKNGFAPVLILVLAVMIVVIGYFFFYKTPIKNQQESLTTVNEPYKSIFLGVSKIFSDNLDPKIQISYSANGKLYWPISNGAVATIGSSPGIQIGSLCGNLGDENSLFASKMDKSLTKLGEYFSANNFKKVIVNPYFSTTPFSKSDLGSVIGYQSDNQGLMCTLVFGSSCGGKDVEGQFFRSGSLNCNTAENVNKSISSQLDYLLAFGTSGNALDMVDNYGNYYYFFSNSLIGPGAGIYATKSPAGWIKISETQDYLRCDLANEYKVPHQLKSAEKCYDPILQKNIDNPN